MLDAPTQEIGFLPAPAEKGIRVCFPNNKVPTHAAGRGEAAAALTRTPRPQGSVCGLGERTDPSNVIQLIWY